MTQCSAGESVRIIKAKFKARKVAVLNEKSIECWLFSFPWPAVCRSVGFHVLQASGQYNEFCTLSNSIFAAGHCLAREFRMRFLLVMHQEWAKWSVITRNYNLIGIINTKQ